MDQRIINGTRETKNGTAKMVSIAFPLEIFEELERRANSDDRPISKQVIHYVRAALSSPQGTK